MSHRSTSTHLARFVRIYGLVETEEAAAAEQGMRQSGTRYIYGLEETKEATAAEQSMRQSGTSYIQSRRDWGSGRS